MRQIPLPAIRRKQSSSTPLQIEMAGNCVPFLRFPEFDRKGDVRHAFSTRSGGVSKGVFSTMNLSFTRGDSEEAVTENFARMATALDAQNGDIVCTYQTHTVNVRAVGRSDRGKGVTRERDYRDVDGIITDEPGVVLACFMADCVPLLFADPAHHAIDAAHAGWRGTVSGMAIKMVQAMQEQYGSEPATLLAAIGPSVCGDCYEVSEDVAMRARDALWKLPASKGNERAMCTDVPEEKHSDAVLRPADKEGKYLLDLHALNRLMLLHAGLQPQNIFVTDICTCCNPELLFSHRVQGEARGSLAAFIRLAEDNP